MKPVSIVISTRNAGDFIGNCLKSITEQSVKPLETIVVDRDSTDRTKEISQKFTSKVYNHGPERSTQRNFGAEKAVGDWLFFVDADMVLGPKVIEDAVSLIEKESTLGAIVVPEESFGEGYLSRVKAFERSFYLGDNNIEAPRLIAKKVFLQVGGYSEKMVSGEDWDLRRKLEKNGVKIGRIKELIYHNEGRLTLGKTLGKKFYYGRQINNYLDKNRPRYSQISPIRTSFFKDPVRLITNPRLSVSMITLKTLELGAAFLGLMTNLILGQKKTR